MPASGLADPITVARADPAQDRLVEQHFRSRANWFAMIEALRVAYELTIDQAERMALSNRGWRRWCNSRLRVDRRCRKLARDHLRLRGEGALVGQNGDGFVILSPDLWPEP